jgi:preprotein translocase subunit SecG
MLVILAVLQGVFVLCMILLVLMQKTSTDGMANLAGSSAKSMHSSVRMDFVKKSTIFFAAAFIINSLLMANIGYHQNNSTSIIEKIHEHNDEIPLDDE